MKTKPHTINYVKVRGMDNDASGDIVVRSHAIDGAATAQWAKRLDIPYAGQSLGTFAGSSSTDFSKRDAGGTSQTRRSIRYGRIRGTHNA